MAICHPIDENLGYTTTIQHVKLRRVARWSNMSRTENLKCKKDLSEWARRRLFIVFSKGNFEGSGSLFMSRFHMVSSLQLVCRIVKEGKSQQGSFNRHIIAIGCACIKGHYHPGNLEQTRSGMKQTIDNRLSTPTTDGQLPKTFWDPLYDTFVLHELFYQSSEKQTSQLG